MTQPQPQTQPQSQPQTPPLSYYTATANPAPPRPPLEGEQKCDVCIIGAGFSGLATALQLAENKFKVMVVEAVSVGFGASGRNGGQVINGYARDHDTLLYRYGTEMARDLLAMGTEGGELIRSWIEKYRIECDYRPGNFFAAFTKKQMAALEKRKAAWEKIGGTSLWMYGKERMPQVVDSKLYIGGLLDRHGGHLHPLNLALGEAAAIESHGGKIFENSRAIRIEPGLRPKVYTEKGCITASAVVVCGNAYLSDILPELSDRIMSVSSQMVATEVLGEKPSEKVIPSGFCIEDCNFIMDYYRITTDWRLVFGGGVSYDGGTPANIIKKLKPRLTKTFPALKDTKIEFAWGGNFALTMTRMPHIGRVSDTVFFIQGDSGHGVTTCHLLGKLVGEAVNKQVARYDVFATMKCFPFPGGPKFRVPMTMLGAWYYEIKEILGI